MDLDTWKAEIDFRPREDAYVTVCAARRCRTVKPSGRGAIVTTSEAATGRCPEPDRVAYTAAKAGVMAFTRFVCGSCRARARARQLHCARGRSTRRDSAR